MSFKDRRGLTFIIVLVLVLAIALVAVTFVLLSTNEIRMVRRQNNSTKAFYLAEAGIQLAIWELNYGDGTWPGWDTLSDPYTKTILSSDPNGLSTGDMDISVTNSISSTPQIDGIGYTPSKTSFENGEPMSTRRHIRVEMRNAFSYSIVTQTNLELENIETGVIGDVHSNGNIENEGVDVIGTGTAVGTITIEDGGSFSEGYYEGVSPITMPTLDMAYYQAEAGYTYSGEWTVSGTFNISDYSANGIIYVDGNFKAEEATIVGPGTIVATGTIKIEEESVVGSADGMVGLFSNSSDSEEAVKIETDSSCYTIVFAPNGGAKIETDSSLYGAIVANAADVEIGGQLVYKDSLGDITAPESVISWIVLWYEQ